MLTGIANEKLGSNESGDESIAKSSGPQDRAGRHLIATSNPFETLAIEEVMLMMTTMQKIFISFNHRYRDRGDHQRRSTYPNFYVSSE